VISIVVGYRNREIERVKRSLDSLYKQTYSDFEIIFVDYGSDTSIASEIVKLLTTYKFSTYIYSDTRGWFWNRAHALNTGVKLAKGEIVLMCDIDLILESDFIEKISKLDYKNAFYIFECFFLPENFDFEKKNVLIDGIHYRQDYVGLCAAKKEDILAINGLDEYFMVWGAEDEDYYKRLENHGLKMIRLNATEYKVFHKWHMTESPSFPTFWYLTMVDRLFNINNLLTAVDQVSGQILHLNNRKIFSVINNNSFEVELKLNMSNKFLVFHNFMRDFLHPNFLSGKFIFNKSTSKNKLVKKSIFSLAKNKDAEEYISVKEITEFIQYLVGTNRRIIDDYFFDTTGEEIHFYYLKNKSKPSIALY
jgi:glycosyltransferase involved in cell wall biosynthesis